MISPIRVGLLSLALLIPAPVLLADVLQIPDNPTETVAPQRGMSMHQVQRQYGEPAARLPAIGVPPITRWRYPNFTVYFEHQYVIHSVQE